MTKKDIIAIYHDPPLWVGSSPVIRGNNHSINFQIFHDELIRVNLECDIKLSASREGLFAFDFSEWNLNEAETEILIENFDKAVDKITQRTLFINAFLSFLYTGMLVDGQGSSDRMIVTPEIVIPMDEFGKQGGMSFGNSRVSYLALSGYESTYRPQLPLIMDERISMRHKVVAISTIEAAAQNVDYLIRQEGMTGLNLCELFLRSNKAYQDHNYSLSLIMSWTVVEKSLNNLWIKYQEKNKHRSGKLFIDKSRKQRLNDNRTFTSAVIVEILSLNGKLDLSYYKDINVVRKSRNDWIHGLKSVNAADSWKALELSAALLSLGYDINLKPDGARRIHY